MSVYLLVLIFSYIIYIYYVRTYVCLYVYMYVCILWTWCFDIFVLIAYSNIVSS